VSVLEKLGVVFVQFVVIGRDGKDAGALERRMKARPAHAALGDKMELEGKLLFRAALLNEKGEMNGSVIAVDLPSRKEVDEWLAKEPYCLQGVWREVETLPCKAIPRLK
jgi:uncharacterized protein YciI